MSWRCASGHLNDDEDRRCLTCELRENDRSQREEERARAERTREEERASLLREQIALEEGWQAEQGTCGCCGQHFVESTRRRLVAGVEWRGILGRFAAEGLCPRCYHERLDKGEERSWSRSDWEDHCEQCLDAASTAAAVSEVEGEIEKRLGSDTELVSRAAAKHLRLQKEEDTTQTRRFAESIAAARTSEELTGLMNAHPRVRTLHADLDKND